jgi:ribonuclease HI
LEENRILIYTDGSCFLKRKGLGGPSGIGVVLIQGENVTEISKYLGNDLTCNQAELLAIERAIDESRGQNILIYTDSNISRNCITGKWNPRKNLNIIGRIKTKLLMKIMRKESVEIRRVPAHKGIWGNERADYLAKQGAKGQSIKFEYKKEMLHGNKRSNRRVIKTSSRRSNKATSARTGRGRFLGVDNCSQHAGSNMSNMAVVHS